MRLRLGPTEMALSFGCEQNEASCAVATALLTVLKFRGLILFVGFLTYLFTCLLRYVAFSVDTFQMRKGLLTLSLVK